MVIGFKGERVVSGPENDAELTTLVVLEELCEMPIEIFDTSLDRQWSPPELNAVFKAKRHHRVSGHQGQHYGE